MMNITKAVNNSRKAGVRRMIKNNLKVDMTPMVDLGFLLITFFVITTEMAKPTAMNLYMPKDGGEPTELGASNAITVLLENDKIYYYKGAWDDAAKTGTVIETNLSGTGNIRKIISDKQRLLDITAKDKEGRDGLMLLIKPGKEVSYKNVVDMLDETTICRVKKYAIVKQSADEKAWLTKHIAK
jgi:biopolymer transport protein ExbD